MAARSDPPAWAGSPSALPSPALKAFSPRGNQRAFSSAMGKHLSCSVVKRYPCRRAPQTDTGFAGRGVGGSGERTLIRPLGRCTHQTCKATGDRCLLMGTPEWTEATLGTAYPSRGLLEGGLPGCEWELGISPCLVLPPNPAPRSVYGSPARACRGVCASIHSSLHSRGFMSQVILPALGTQY